jgi:antitoxin component YwqK of YwqJK toxin-antitoxin module
MQQYIPIDLIKYVISDYISYYNLMSIPILKLNPKRIYFKTHKSEIFKEYKNICDVTEKFIDDNVVWFKAETGYTNYMHNINNQIIIHIIYKQHYYENLINKNKCGKSIQYTIKYGLTRSLKKVYAVNGSLISLCHLKNNIYVGKYLTWYGNCILKFVENYVDGFQNGLQIKYFSNGNKKEEFTVKNGKFDNWLCQWDEFGNLENSYFYIDGVMENFIATTYRIWKHNRFKQKIDKK